MPTLKKDKKKLKNKKLFFTLYIVIKKKIIKNKLWHGKKGVVFYAPPEGDSTFCQIFDYKKLTVVSTD